MEIKIIIDPLIKNRSYLNICSKHRKTLKRIKKKRKTDKRTMPTIRLWFFLFHLSFFVTLLTNFESIFLMTALNKRINETMN